MSFELIMYKKKRAFTLSVGPYEYSNTFEYYFVSNSIANLKPISNDWHSISEVYSVKQSTFLLCQ